MPAPRVRELLIQLRAPIFNTLPVVNNTRTGMKYLKGAMRAPRALEYFQPGPKIRTLKSPNSIYGGWQDAPMAPGWSEFPRMRAPGLSKTGEGEAPSNWIETAREYFRMRQLFKTRRKNKGPPKKGEGKKAQLKAKKK